MTDHFIHAVEVVLEHEGGLVDHPADPGGVTNWGISQRSYPNVDIRNLSRARAIAIYHDDWWRRYRYGDLRDRDVATKVFDMAVNMGPSAAHRLLQEAINEIEEGVIVDGIIGPQTLGAANRMSPRVLLSILRYKAAEHYYRIVLRRPESMVFLLGWLRRAFT